MICPYDVDTTCPYTEEMIDDDPDLCIYCDDILFGISEDVKK